MRAVLQRVEKASVSVNGEVTGSIDAGLLVYVGVGNEDNHQSADALAKKVANLRIFDDSDGKLNLSIRDVEGQLLVIPNFTLMADARKGRRPAFNTAAPAEIAEPLQQRFMESLKKEGCFVEAGVFRADMTIDSIARGPINIILDVP